MLKIVIDATPVSQNPSGVGLYVINLINSLYKFQSQDSFQLGVAYQPSFKNWLSGRLNFPDLLEGYSPLYLVPLPVKISNLIATFPNPLLSYFENYFGQPDIVHGNDYTVYCCQKSRKVMTIHDLGFIKYPTYVNSGAKTYQKRVKQSLKWTDLIVTVSESSKRDIVEYLDVDPNRIYVTLEASRYSSDYLSEERGEELKKSVNYNFSKPYLLFVSTIEPRKNIVSLIEAFNLLKDKYKIDHNLVLVGRKGWKYEPIFEAIARSPWQDQIYHLDYLSDELVALFYSKADAFVYPSHYEGFGLPVLEAMTLGAPVITSNTSSLPEVAGDAALLIDPNDSSHLAEAILQVISDSHLRQELIEKGKERAKLFSWERTAKETLKAYRSLIK